LAIHPQNTTTACWFVFCPWNLKFQEICELSLFAQIFGLIAGLLPVKISQTFLYPTIKRSKFVQPFDELEFCSIKPNTQSTKWSPRNFGFSTLWVERVQEELSSGFIFTKIEHCNQKLDDHIPHLMLVPGVGS
jgi:hypothetical protein